MSEKEKTTAEETAQQTTETEETTDETTEDQEEGDEDMSDSDEIEELSAEELKEKYRKLREQHQKDKKRLARGYKNRADLEQRIVEKTEKVVEERLKQQLDVNELLKNYPDAKAHLDQIKNKQKDLGGKVSLEEAYILIQPGLKMGTIGNGSYGIHGQFRKPQLSKDELANDPIHQKALEDEKQYYQDHRSNKK